MKKKKNMQRIILSTYYSSLALEHLWAREHYEESKRNFKSLARGSFFFFHIWSKDWWKWMQMIPGEVEGDYRINPNTELLTTDGPKSSSRIGFSCGCQPLTGWTTRPDHMVTRSLSQGLHRQSHGLYRRCWLRCGYRCDTCSIKPSWLFHSFLPRVKYSKKHKIKGKTKIRLDQKKTHPVGKVGKIIFLYHHYCYVLLRASFSSLHCTTTPWKAHPHECFGEKKRISWEKKNILRGSKGACSTWRNKK